MTLLQVIHLWEYPYVRWHILFIFLPSIIIWVYNWRYLLHYKKTFLFIMICFIVCGIPADILGSSVFHLWYYHPAQHVGPFLLGLPLGEYIFIFFFPQEFVALLLLVRRRIKR